MSDASNKGVIPQEGVILTLVRLLLGASFTSINSRYQLVCGVVEVTYQ